MHKRAMTLASLIVVAALAGCNTGHGSYTQEGMREANSKMAGLKAMNDHQQAEQAFKAGDLDKAMKMIDRSLGANPNVPISYVLRGRILIERGDLENALLCFQKAEALKPETVDAQYYMGIVYERFTQNEDALKHYQKAGELDPSNPQYAVAAAEMMIDLGRVDDAETFLGKQQPTFEHNAGVRQTLGHIALLKGDLPRAVKLFNEAHLLAPDDAVVLEDLIHAQIATGQFGDAQYNIESLLKTDASKDRRDLKQLQARCLLNLDKPVEARELLVQLTGDSQGQKDVDSWIELGNVSFVLKDQARLRLSAQRVLALAPARAEGFTLKALWQRRQGDLVGALDNLNKAVERRGTDTDPLMLRGLVLQELGRTEEARQSYAAVVAQDPANETAKAALTTISYAAAPETDAPAHQ
jgi:Flp pilus assembly protein TadD